MHSGLISSLGYCQILDCQKCSFYSPLINRTRNQVSAISCGIWNNQEILDLDYEEDSDAETDGNFVLTASNGIVELQTTAEKKPFNKEQFLNLLRLAELGTNKIFEIQKSVLDI